MQLKINNAYQVGDVVRVEINENTFGIVCAEIVGIQISIESKLTNEIEKEEIKYVIKILGTEYLVKHSDIYSKLTEFKS